MAIFIYGKSQLHNNLPKLSLMFVWRSCISERISVLGLGQQWGGGSSFKMLLLGGVLTLWLWSPEMLDHSISSRSRNICPELLLGYVKQKPSLEQRDFFKSCGSGSSPFCPESYFKFLYFTWLLVPGGGSASGDLGFSCWTSTHFLLDTLHMISFNSTNNQIVT